MPGDDLQLPNNLEDVERFQRLFVQPMVETVKQEMRTGYNVLREEFKADQVEQKQLRVDVDQLKGNQRKALIGWGVFASGLSLALGACWNWIREKVKIS